MFERFAVKAREAVSLAIEEAGRRGDRKVAADHLLTGILHDPAIAAEVGASPEATQRAADQLDRDALSAIGVDTAAFGPLAAGAGAARLPFTPGAKAVLKRTLVHATAEKSRRIDEAPTAGNPRTPRSRPSRRTPRRPAGRYRRRRIRGRAVAAVFPDSAAREIWPREEWCTPE